MEIDTVAELIAFLKDSNAHPNSTWPEEEGMVLLRITQKQDYVDFGYDYSDTKGMTTTMVLFSLEIMPLSFPVRCAGGLFLTNISYSADGLEVHAVWDDTWKIWD
jgi:hypothetical protein